MTYVQRSLWPLRAMNFSSWTHSCKTVTPINTHSARVLGLPAGPLPAAAPTSAKEIYYRFHCHEYFLLPPFIAKMLYCLSFHISVFNWFAFFPCSYSAVSAPVNEMTVLFSCSAMFPCRKLRVWVCSEFSVVSLIFLFLYKILNYL